MRKRIIRRGLLFLTLYFILIVVLGHIKAHADTEIWSMENVGKTMMKIELNVDGCITSFTVPRIKFEERDDVMQSMLDIAEKRQRLGCH